jgi:hypothetical protein
VEQRHPRERGVAGADRERLGQLAQVGQDVLVGERDRARLARAAGGQLQEGEVGTRRRQRPRSGRAQGAGVVDARATLPEGGGERAIDDDERIAEACHRARDSLALRRRGIARHRRRRRDPAGEERAPERGQEILHVAHQQQDWLAGADTGVDQARRCTARLLDQIRGRQRAPADDADRALRPLVGPRAQEVGQAARPHHG